MPRPPERIRLGDLLIQQNLLTSEQLTLALAEQKRTGRKLGRIFVDSGYVTEDGIAKALARQLKAEFVDLRTFNPDPALIKLLPEAQARRFRVLVLTEDNGLLRVGFADPTDIAVYDEVTRVLRRDIDLAVIVESQLMPLLDRVYRRTEEISGLAKELTQEMGDVPVEFGAVLGIAPGAEDAPVVKLLQTVFEEAQKTRASDIHIEPQERSLIIRFRIDGVLHVQTEADSKIATALVLRLKLMSGLDISEKRLPQDGRFNIKIRGQSVDVRISTMPTQHGESVVMRLLAQNTGLLELDRLHTNSAIQSIPRLLDLNIKTNVLAGNVIGIVAQRLVRTLCPKCKKPDAPAEVEARLLGVAPGESMTVYRPVGCPACEFNGYKGRMAIFELLKFDKQLDELIVRDASIGTLEEHARSRGFASMADDGLRRVREGITTIDEVSRVVDLTENIA